MCFEREYTVANVWTKSKSTCKDCLLDVLSMTKKIREHEKASLQGQHIYTGSDCHCEYGRMGHPRDECEVLNLKEAVIKEYHKHGKCSSQVCYLV